VGDSFEWHHDSIMENVETKEKLVIKKMASHKVALESYELDQKMVLISRYPLNVDKKWIDTNEQEVLDWNYDEQDSRIQMDNPIRIPMYILKTL
jgi:hypothetical protein